MQAKTMTLIGHLEELRKVIIVSVLAVFCGGIIAYFGFQDRLINFLTAPIRAMNYQLVMISVLEGFYTKIQVSFLAGVLLAFPVLIWQVLSFVLPALYLHEKKYLYVLLPASTLLFFFGVAFCYMTVFQIALRFLLVVGGSGLQPMISVSKYISFLISFLIPFGLVFEWPLVVYFLAKIGLITPETLVRRRKYALLMIVVIAAALTPGPDIISQLLMAVPMVLLYEVSILIAKVIRVRKDSQREVEDSL